MTDINALKSAISAKFAPLAIHFDTADEFANRELYSSLIKPLVVICLKSVASNDVSTGKPASAYTMPSHGEKSDIVIGFKIYCPILSAGGVMPYDISSKLADCILSANAFDTSGFSYGKISYNSDYELYEQECEVHFYCVSGGV